MITDNTYVSILIQEYVIDLYETHECKNRMNNKFLPFHLSYYQSIELSKLLLMHFVHKQDLPEVLIDIRVADKADAACVSYYVKHLEHYIDYVDSELYSVNKTDEILIDATIDSFPDATIHYFKKDIDLITDKLIFDWMRDAYMPCFNDSGSYAAYNY